MNNIKTKLAFALVAIVMALGFQSCGNDDPVIIERGDLVFKAMNLSVGDGELCASSNSSVSVSISVTVTENGESTPITIKTEGNQLPVRAGDEIEVQFTPINPEQTEAYFTMPDGSTQKATTSSPSFKWTVPENFTSGMQIIGESRYETDDSSHIDSGIITLVPLK